MSGREDMSHFLPTFTLLAAVGSVAGVSFSFSWSVLMSCLGGALWGVVLIICLMFLASLQHLIGM
jgi:hypothetical protein